MGIGALERRRVVVAHGKLRSDISIPSNVPLGQTLNVLGLIQAGTIVLLPNGHSADLALAPDSGNPSNRIPEGTLLTIINQTALGKSDRASKNSAAALRGTLDRTVWWFASALAVVSLATAWLNASAIETEVLPDYAFNIASLAFGLAALISAISSTRIPAGKISVSALTVPPVLAFSAGFVSVSPRLAESIHLATLCGFLGATVAIAIVHLRCGKLFTMNSTGLVLGTLATASALWGLTLQLSIPETLAAALAAGFAPLALRILPSLCLDVEDGQLIEYDQFMSGKWTVRGSTPKTASAVTEKDVAGMMSNARSQLATGTVLFSAIPALMLPIVLTSVSGSTLESIGALVLAGCVVVSLMLTPRQAGAPLQRWVPRAGAALVLAQLTALALLSMQEGGMLIAALSVILVGLCMVGAIVPVSRGIRSLSLSRFADIAETLTTALALPAACVAANLIEIVRGMVS